MIVSPLRAFAILLCAPLLAGCPPEPNVVCSKLFASRPAGTVTSDGEFRADCAHRLDALKGRSSGEYGACAQCVMDAVDQAHLAACRPLCAGLDDMLTAPPPR